MVSRLLTAQPVEHRAAVAAALASPVGINVAMLLYLDFADGPLALSNRNVPFADLRHGRTYAPGAGYLVRLPSTLDGGAATLAPWREYALGLPFEALDLPDGSTRAEYLAALMGYCGDVAQYRGRGAELALQLFDADNRLPVGWPIVMDVSLMDRMSLSMGRDGAVITLSVEALLARKGVPVYGMQTHRDQLRRYSGDQGYEFTTEASRVVTWTAW